MSSDRTKQICLWMTIYIYKYMSENDRWKHFLPVDYINVLTALDSFFHAPLSSTTDLCMLLGRSDKIREKEIIYPLIPSLTGLKFNMWVWTKQLQALNEHEATRKKGKKKQESTKYSLFLEWCWMILKILENSTTLTKTIKLGPVLRRTEVPATGTYATHRSYFLPLLFRHVSVSTISTVNAETSPEKAKCDEAFHFRAVGGTAQNGE